MMNYIIFLRFEKIILHIIKLKKILNHIYLSLFLMFFNLLNKRRRTSQNNESKKEDKIVDLEKDPVTKEYKPKE